MIDITKQELFVALNNPKVLGFIFFKRVGAQWLNFGLGSYAIPTRCHLIQCSLSCPALKQFC